MNLCITAIGLLVGLIELIAACIVNFHTFGFIAGLVCMGLSIFFSFLNCYLYDIDDDI